MNNKYPKLQDIFVSIGLTLSLVGCGEIGLGNRSPNDPKPTGTIVAQGNLTGQSGQTASGSAFVYQTGSASFVVRLEGVTLPEESGLRVIVSVNSDEKLNASLRSSSGTQNYSMTVSTLPATFDYVAIRSTQSNPDVDYAKALFSTVP